MTLYRVRMLEELLNSDWLSFYDSWNFGTEPKYDRSAAFDRFDHQQRLRRRGLTRPSPFLVGPQTHFGTMDGLSHYGDWWTKSCPPHQTSCSFKVSSKRLTFLVCAPESLFGHSGHSAILCNLCWIAIITSLAQEVYDGTRKRGRS